MKKIYIILAAAAICLPATAQNLNSAYFLDGYKYSHRLNPAFAPSRSYFSIPVVGGLSANVRSDMGISTFLYPEGDGLTTFMNGSVSSEEFLSRLKRNNDLSANLGVNLLSMGIWGRDGFTSAEINLRIGANANIPRDLFDFMKNVGAKSSYNISDLDIRAQSYVELALGHSHVINENLNVGAKVKFLVGVADASAHVDDLNVVMNEDLWKITAAGRLDANVPGLSIPTKEGSNELDFNGIAFDGEKLTEDLGSSLGYGAAIDLGAEYKFIDGPLEGLNLSAAVLNLGFISWGAGNISGTTAGEGWEFSGFENVSLDENSENSIDTQIQALGDDLAKLLVFNEAQPQGRTRMLDCTLNLGAEYEMPFYRKLSVGFLYSSRFSGLYSRHEGRFSANVTPLNWLGFSASYGISNYGSSFGTVLNFDLPGFGLFIGSDCFNYRFTPPVESLGGLSVPTRKINLNVCLGITFNMGRMRSLGDMR